MPGMKRYPGIGNESIGLTSDDYDFVARQLFSRIGELECVRECLERSNYIEGRDSIVTKNADPNFLHAITGPATGRSENARRRYSRGVKPSRRSNALRNPSALA